MSEDLPLVGDKVEAPNNRGKRGQIKRTPIVDAILSNETFKGTAQYKSVRELAEEFGVLPTTVYTHRTRLGLRKMIEVANNGQKYTNRVPVPPELKAPYDKSAALSERNRQGLMQSYTRAAVTTDDLVRSLDGEGVLTPLDRLKMLSRLIRVGSPMIKIAAIKAIEDLSKTSEARVGPPAPLNAEERQTRLMRLFLAMGKEEVKAAYDATFPSKEEPEEEIQPYAGELLSSGGEAAEPVQDLPTGETP